MRKITLIVVLITFIFAVNINAQSQRNGLLFQLGIGPGWPSWPSDFEDLLSYADSQPGVDRIKLALNLGLGLPINDKTYVLGRIDGVADRVYDSSDYIQMNVYLYSLGLRYYPSVTGFYVDGNLGASRAVMQISGVGSESSDWDTGFGVGLGYNFSKKPTGFGLSIEARYLMLSIEGEQVGALMGMLNLSWN